MFQSTASVKAQAAERSVRPLIAEYIESAESWYDGSLQSVDSRIAKCSHVLSSVAV